MIDFAEWIAAWLGDYYLLSTVLLALAVVIGSVQTQPAYRLAIVKSTVAALFVMAVLCALPGWPRVPVFHGGAEPEISMEPGLQAGLSASSSSAEDVLTVLRAPDAARADAASAAGAANAPAGVEARTSWRLLVGVAYLGGALIVVTWLSLGALAAWQLRREASAAPRELVARLSEITVRRPISSGGLSYWVKAPLPSPALYVSGRITVPAALGLFRPSILLPRTFAATALQSPNGAMDAVLAHELAHIRNGDLLWLAFFRLMTIALWAQPLFWMLKRRLRLDQESLADAAAAEMTNRVDYAAQLVEWASETSVRRRIRVASAVGLWETPSQLRRRLAVLLNERLTVRRRCSSCWQLSWLGLMAASAFTLTLLTLEPTRVLRAQAGESGGAPAPAVVDEAARIERGAGEKLGQRAPTTVPNSFSGQAIDEQGKGIADVEVYLFRSSRDGGVHEQMDHTHTNEAGMFRFAEVIDLHEESPDETRSLGSGGRGELIEVVLRKKGQASQMWLESPRVVLEQGVHQKLVLRPAATLRGRVTGPDGEPVAGAHVSILHGPARAWSGIYASRSDANGYYLIADAPRFDLAEFQKKLPASDIPADMRILSPVLLMVERTGFAAHRGVFKKSPGVQDVELERAAVLEGKAIDGRQGKPIAGAVIEVSTTPEIVPGPLMPGDVTRFHQARTETDSDGRFRIATLPGGKYDISASAAGLVCEGVSGLEAKGGRTAQVGDLTLGPGGVVRIRLVDSQTAQPVPVVKGMTATVVAASNPPQTIGRAIQGISIAPNARGRFELRTPPGLRQIVAGGVQSPEGAVRWQGQQPTLVQVTEGQTVDVDVPVVGNSVPPQPVTNPRD